MALIMASPQLSAQLTDCQNACASGTLQTYTETVNFPNYGAMAGDNINYTITYRVCNGILYLVTMNWKAKYKGKPLAYNVGGYDRVNELMGLVWANIPGINTIAFPASCFRVNTLFQKNANVEYEGIVTGTDYTTFQLSFCNPGCCIFNKGEFAGDEIEIQDDGALESCKIDCWPFCRGDREKRFQ